PLVAQALARDIARGPVEKMDAPRRHVDVTEEMPLHERAIAARIGSPQAEELVEVERDRARKVGAAGAMQPHDLAVQRNRCPAGRQSQHEMPVPRELPRDVTRQHARDRVGVWEDPNLHMADGSWLMAMVHGRPSAMTISHQPSAILLYRGTCAAPRASASASHTAPFAGSSSSNCTRQP